MDPLSHKEALVTGKNKVKIHTNGQMVQTVSDSLSKPGASAHAMPSKGKQINQQKTLTVSHAAQSVYTSTQDAGLTVQSPPFLHGLDEHSSTSVSQFNP